MTFLATRGARVMRAARGRATVVALVLGAYAMPAAAQTPAPTSATIPAARADSLTAIFRRAQRLVNDGAGAEGRALVDSVLEATEPRSAEEAEALYWRATLAESWDRAQRDYLRIMLEHEHSPRAGDAMLRLAQGEAARGDREAAVRYLERLAREAPQSEARAEGGLWLGRLLVERGMQREGCRILRDARTLVRPGALELANQFEYLLNACPTETAAADSVAAAEPTPTPPPAAEPAVEPAATRRDPAWSVQAAAFRTEAEAKALVDRLRERGYDARVDGTSAPWRVRFGRFTTRAAAAAAMQDYRARERADAFLVQVPPG